MRSQRRLLWHGTVLVRDAVLVFDFTLFFCSLFIPDDFRFYMSNEMESFKTDLTHIKASLGCFFSFNLKYCRAAVQCVQLSCLGDQFLGLYGFLYFAVV